MSKKIAILMFCLAFLSLGCGESTKKWSWPKMGRGKDKAAAQEAPQAVGNYTVTGILTVSELFTGASPRYLVRDSQTQAIQAYVESPDGAVNLAENVGARVEITGQVRQDGVLGLVVEARKITVVDRKAQAEEPAEPPPPPPQTLEPM